MLTRRLEILLSSGLKCVIMSYPLHNNYSYIGKAILKWYVVLVIKMIFRFYILKPCIAIIHFENCMIFYSSLSIEEV